MRSAMGMATRLVEGMRARTETIVVQEESTWAQPGLGPTWGHHLILDIAGCREDVATDPDALRDFVAALVEAIDMRAYGEPLIAHFAEHEPALAGWTLIQLIETSSITAHFVDVTGNAHVDIFSCLRFDPNAAVEVIRERLAPRALSARLLARRA